MECEVWIVCGCFYHGFCGNISQVTEEGLNLSLGILKTEDQEGLISFFKDLRPALVQRIDLCIHYQEPFFTYTLTLPKVSSLLIGGSALNLFFYGLEFFTDKDKNLWQHIIKEYS
jgi:hypothetical protein